MMGITDEEVSWSNLLTSPCMTASARFGTKQAPLVCSPLWRIPSMRYGSLSVTSRYETVVSPLPARNSIPVSGSYSGIKILQMTSKHAVTHKSLTFFISVIVLLSHYKSRHWWTKLQWNHTHPVELSNTKVFSLSSKFLRSRITTSLCRLCQNINSTQLSIKLSIIEE